MSSAVAPSHTNGHDHGPPSVTPVADRVAPTIALAVLGVFVTYLPITGVSAALEAIRVTTSATTTDLQWVSDAYVIPMAAAILSAGIFGERYGRRTIFVVGMGMSVAGAAIAAAAAASGAAPLLWLWTGQAVSGLAAGLLLPTTLGLISHAVADPRRRGNFITLWATGIFAGLAIGPLVTGLILEWGGWSWIFAPAASLSLIIGILGQLILPRVAASSRAHLDWAGQVLSTVAIIASIFGAIQGGDHGWTSPGAIAGLAIGVLALAALILVERRSTAPLLDLSLFRSVSFTVAGYAAVAALFSIVGVLFILSVYFGGQETLAPLDVALRILCIPAVAAVASPLVASLLRSFTPMTVLTSGLIVALIGLLLMLGIETGSSYLDLAWRFGVFGLSFSLIIPSVAIVAINSAPRQKAAMAGATNTALRQYGGALGPAVLGSLYVSSADGGASASEALHLALVVNCVVVGLAALACAVAPRRRSGV